MKNKLIKLSLLIFTMSVIISSRQNAGASNYNENLIKDEDGLNNCPGYAASLLCKQTRAAETKKQRTQSEALSDSDLPLSPISRFILLQ